MKVIMYQIFNYEINGTLKEHSTILYNIAQSSGGGKLRQTIVHPFAKVFPCQNFVLYDSYSDIIY